MTAAKNVEELRQLFAGYFHEDWTLDGGSPDDVVDQFIRESGQTSQELAALGETLLDYIAEQQSDSDLERAMWRELGCYYLPSAAGVSCRVWLTSVAAKLMRAG